MQPGQARAARRTEARSLRKKARRNCPRLPKGRVVIVALGWLGACLLAFCGVPLLVNTRFGDRLFLWAWFLGELCLLCYVSERTPRDWPLTLNYGFNALLVSFVIWRRSRARS